ncbi:hypothetical protein Scep_021253 [Stephania cephalantha]|uniref:DUF7804 domain-containing protein n=1 Tax=Stephania cephalantha TaxID=152367 RepID=A0AAP0FD28_9MAGN
MAKRMRVVPVQACSVSVGKDSDRKGGSASWLLDSYGDKRFGGDAMICSSSWNHRQREATVSADILHYWITNSISEIVRHIREAPFLVYVYSNPNSKSDSNPVTLRREIGIAERWPRIKRSWDEGSPVPDGIILVEQLESFTYDEDFEERTDSTTRLWGILVQGRGAESHGCYLLKTCTVCSAGACCTHFILVRTQSFEDTAESQLINSWIL